MKLRFSKRALVAIQPPKAGKRLNAYDIEIPKLALRVTSNGTKTFYVVKRTGREIAWIKLGTFPDMSVEVARNEATRTLAEFTSGVNPAIVRRKLKKEPTLSEFFVVFGEKHGKLKKSWRSDIQRFKQYIEKPLGKKKLSEIDRASVRDVIEGVQKAGMTPGTQRQIRSLISTILGRAVDWDYLEFNPASRIKVAGAIVKRDRFLLSDELPRFFAALNAEPSNVMRDFILLAVLTGARKTNLLEMHWSDIDFNTATWRIGRTKNGDPQIVTLSEQAIEVLEGRRKQSKSGFVFPANSRSGHIDDPKPALMRVMERAGIPYGRKVPNGITLHDLRRTLGSWQAMTGSSLTIIGKSLNHKSHASTAIYAQLENTQKSSPVRESVKRATDAMFAQVGSDL